MIRVSQLEFAYGKGDFILHVDELTVEAGEQIALIGASGSGKSTLLHLLAGILSPRSGSIVVQEHDLRQLGDSARRDFRNAKIGLVFQEFELIEYLNVLDNIILPFRINTAQRLTADARRNAATIAKSLEVDDKLRRFPHQLSQGERQRVAIARALVTQPELLLADEPTGNLDPDNKNRVLNLMLRQATEQNVTVVMVTHDHGLLDRFGRVIDMRDFHAGVSGDLSPKKVNVHRVET